MNLKLCMLALATIFLSGCSVSVEKAGIEVMSNPEAKVYIDGKEAGSTPYKNNSLSPKEVDIRLVTEKGEWSKRIRLQNRTSTIIHREFDPKTGDNGGYVLKIEPTGDKTKAGLIVTARPDRANIRIDGDTKGQSPGKWNDIGEGEKQIDISFPTKKKVIVFAKAIAGYQLIVEADLTDEAIDMSDNASQNETQNSQIGNKVEIVIKETETGWLRVRGQPNGSSAEIGKVNPKEKYELIGEQDGYYEIRLKENESGWILAKYADKVSGLDQRTE